MLPIIAILSLLCMVGIYTHYYTYDQLFRQLYERKIIGADFKATWTEYLGAWGCMGFIRKLEREVDPEKLTDSDIALIRKASLAYYLSVPTFSVLVVTSLWLS